MREIQILASCDACWQDGEVKTPSAGAWTVGIMSGEGMPALKVLDLCEQHTKLVTDLVALLADVKLTPGKAAPTEQARLFDAPRRSPPKLAALLRGASVSEDAIAEYEAANTYPRHEGAGARDDA